MWVNVVGRHMSLGTEQRSHAEAEAQKLGRFFDGVNEVKVTFERENKDVKAEIVCMVSGGKTLVATETGSTIHESLEFASDNMARQIKRYKGKLRDHRGARAAKGSAGEAAEASDRSPRTAEEE